MPPVKKKAPAKKEPVMSPREEVRASSVLFGLVIIAAVIVASAAWMGGSLKDIESRMARLADSMARGTGLAVEKVQVVGLDEELEAYVRAAAMIEPGENMFRADPHDIRKRIEATGAVTNVRVHRMWPDVIVVLADPARPVALWRDQQVWRVIDSSGQVRADLRPEAFPALPRFAGEGVPEALPVLMETLSDETAVLERFEGAIRHPGGRWTLLLEGEVLVHLPQQARMEAALDAIADLQEKSGVLNGAFSVVDARAAAPRLTENRKAQVFLTPRGQVTASLEPAEAG